MDDTSQVVIQKKRMDRVESKYRIIDKYHFFQCHILLYPIQ